jgi:hypothetical protein
MARGGHGLPKVSLGLPCATLLHPAGGPPLKWPYGRFMVGLPAGVACLQGSLSAAVFYPFGYPTTYAYGGHWAWPEHVLSVLDVHHGFKWIHIRTKTCLLTFRSFHAHHTLSSRFGCTMPILSSGREMATHSHPSSECVLSEKGRNAEEGDVVWWPHTFLGEKKIIWILQSVPR